MIDIPPLLKKMYGSAVIAANLKGQLRIAFRPREKIDALRDRRVRSIVNYAARTVPYYRKLFAREQMEPGDIRTASDLDRLPLLNKELVRSQPHLFLAQSAAGRNALPFFSSGSTGSPIQIYHDTYSLLANISFGERERRAVIQTCGSFRPTELYVGYENSTFKNVVSFYEKNVLFPVRPKRRFVSMSEPTEKVAAIINEESPDIITGYGGWIHLFFKTINSRGISIQLPKMIMYMGEALPSGGREFIEDNLGVPLFSRYNTIEAFKIGFYCEQRKGFHLHEDLCHVRVIGVDGKTLPPGQLGPLVISNLVNRGTVLLNYPVGDIGSLSPTACSCGRTFRLLSELEGRVEDVLRLADGRFVHPRMIWKVLKGDDEILQYQVIQQDLQRFEVGIVATHEEAFRRIVDRALPKLKQLLGPDAQIQAIYRNGFPRHSGEKFRAVTSLV